jgi:hypothetical protein
LRRTCLRVCAKPTTLLAAFAAGGLIGITSTRVERSNGSGGEADADASSGSSRRLLTTLGALGLNLTTRYLASRAGEAMYSSVIGSRDDAPGA